MMVWFFCPAQSLKRLDHVRCAAAKKKKECPNSSIAGLCSSGLFTTICLTKSSNIGLFSSRRNLDGLRPASRLSQASSGLWKPREPAASRFSAWDFDIDSSKRMRVRHTSCMPVFKVLNVGPVIWWRSTKSNSPKEIVVG